IDDKRVPLPVPTAAAHPELHVGRRARPIVERDHAVRVVLVPDEDDTARRLDDAERREVIETRDTWYQTASLRVDVLGPGRIFIRRLEILSQRRGPWLIRDVTVGRIDDEARVALDDARNTLIDLLRAAQGGIERMGSAAHGTPRAFHIRLGARTALRGG